MRRARRPARDSGATVSRFPTLEKLHDRVRNSHTPSSWSVLSRARLSVTKRGDKPALPDLSIVLACYRRGDVRARSSLLPR
jgi:hypothetical protein